MKNFKYRIYPTKSQETLLNKTLNICKDLYNHFLEERKESWEKEKKSINCYKQIKSITGMKTNKPELKLVHSQVLQNIPQRLDLAFQSFFRRLKAKDSKAGYPRFKSIESYNSITYPQFGNGIKLIDGELTLSKLDKVKIIYHRELLGKPKTAIIKKSFTNKWYIIISSDCENKPLPLNKIEVGIDMGLTTFAVFSDTSKINNPKFFKQEENNLAKVQRQLSKIDKNNKRRKKIKRKVARVHERIKFRRDNFTHQESKKVIDKYGIICIEDLNINKMKEEKTKRLSKSISDTSWGEFLNKVCCKAESAGRKLIKVNPAYTSQDCSRCGVRVKKELEDRVHICPNCGLVMDRDLNASLNIKRLGLQSLG